MCTSFADDPDTRTDSIITCTILVTSDKPALSGSLRVRDIAIHFIHERGKGPNPFPIHLCFEVSKLIEHCLLLPPVIGILPVVNEFPKVPDVSASIPTCLFHRM